MGYECVPEGKGGSEIEKHNYNFCNCQGPNKKQMAQSNRRVHGRFIYKGSIYIRKAEGRGHGHC